MTRKPLDINADLARRPPPGARSAQHDSPVGNIR